MSNHLRSRAPQPVRPGTAENLARLAHFRALDLPEADELDSVAYQLLGAVGDTNAKRELWEQIRVGDGRELWFLIAADWDDRDLDELTEEQYRRLEPADHAEELDARYEVTRDRLVHDIERTIWLARARAAEIDAAVARHPAGSRLATGGAR
jgi:hypothetical protein